MLPTLSPMQNHAVKAVDDWYKLVSNNEEMYADEAPVFYLGGYAGTGKSTILPVIIDKLGISLDSIIFCAPTGKAAKVMTEKLKQFGIHRRAGTIHSNIYRPRLLRVDVLIQQHNELLTQREEITKYGGSKDKLADLERSIKMVEKDIDKAYDINEGPKFSLNTESTLREAKLVVVDEASMVGMMVADDLKGFGVPILAIGDPGQLPPVQDEPGLCIGEPDFHLSEIHRQALDNPIIRLSMQAREGSLLKVGKYGTEVDVITRLNDKATYDLDREAQIIVGTNKTRWRVTQKSRKMMGFNNSGPMAGELLIVTKNSRNYPDLVNGAFVTCSESIAMEEGRASFQLKVEDENSNKLELPVFQGTFEEHYLGFKGASSASKRDAHFARKNSEQMDWGWVITCHKAQGSQWDDVIVHDESGSFREDAHRWLYTAITRAAKRLTIVQ